MAEQFYTILTKVGKAKIANANALGTKLNLTKFILGDGNGSYYNPIEDQTNLKNKVWEGLINSITIDKDNPNWIVINTVIPATVGGFMIREAGVFDNEGNMIAIGKYPETYKPVVSEGSAKDLYINMIIEVSSTQNVTLKVDPTVILANKKDIEILSNRIDNIKFPVTSVNAKKGDVVLKAEDIKTEDNTTVAEEIKNIKTDMKDKDLKTFETDVLLTPLLQCNGGFVSTELYGRTLVNNILESNASRLIKYSNMTLAKYKVSVQKTVYTLIGNISNSGDAKDKNLSISFNSGSTTHNLITCKDGIFVTKIDLSKADNLGDLWIYQINNTITSTPALNNVMLLEGDWTNNIPNYFEGMRHAGQYTYVNGKYIVKNLINDKDPKRFFINGATNKLNMNSNVTSYVLENPILNTDMVLTRYGGDRYFVATFDKLEDSTDSIEVFSLSDAVKTFKLTKQAKYLVCYVDSTGKDVKAQLEVGTIPTDYEPYQEGVRIDNITKTKNLFNLKDITLLSTTGADGTKLSNGINVKNTNASYAQTWFNIKNLNPSKRYTLKANKVLISSGRANIDVRDKLDGTLTNVTSGNSTNNYTAVFTPPSDGEVKIKLYSTLNTVETGRVDYLDIQLEEGNVATEYVEYDENKTEILTKEPLAKWNKISTDGTVEVGTTNNSLNGSENWKKANENATSILFEINLSNTTTLNNDVICDKLPVIDVNTLFDTNSTIEGCSKNGNGVFRVRFNKSKLGILEADTDAIKIQKIKAYLTVNNIMILYQLVDSAKTYYNINKALIQKAHPNGYLQCNCGPVQAHIEGTYSTNMGERATSMENAIDKLQEDVQDLESAMLTTAGDIVALEEKNTKQEAVINSKQDKILFSTTIPTKLEIGQICLVHEV